MGLSRRKAGQVVNMSPPRACSTVMDLDDEEEEITEDNSIELEYAALDTLREPMQHSIEAEYEALSIDDARKKIKRMETIDLIHPSRDKAMISWSHDAPEMDESPSKKSTRALGTSDSDKVIGPTILELSPRKSRRSHGGA